MADFDIEATVRELKDRAEIRDVMLRYCRGVDRCDHGLTLSAYHKGATDHHGSFVGSAEEFADWAIRLHREQLVWTSHYITNHYCEIEGDSATAETYVQAILRYESDDKLFDIVGCGRYLDKLERRDGKWGIVERIVLGDWDRVDEVTDRVEGDLVAKLIRGTRDSKDPSYGYFRAA
ncbi:nuclear transport factor 2 family protein [Sphingobium sp. R-7]|uniref:nuclear transport factor 2 family protein n=1 Tax=Sphingobium sp. R-7 TaxID=3375449 RepID=UPI00398AA62B